MTTHSHADMLPRGTLITAGALVLFALTATATVRLAHIPAAASPVAMRAAEHLVPVEPRNLRIELRKAHICVRRHSGLARHRLDQDPVKRGAAHIGQIEEMPGHAGTLSGW